jgi:hypothetical protein
LFFFKSLLFLTSFCFLVIGITLLLQISRKSDRKARLFPADVTYIALAVTHVHPQNEIVPIFCNVSGGSPLSLKITVLRNVSHCLGV